MDIGYGPCTAIGGARYTLLLVDEYSHYKHIYALKNLKGSLLSAMKQFLNDVKVKPTLIRADFDQKLIGGSLKAFLTNETISVIGCPPERQSSNGLCERHWQTLVTMSRNWLTSSLVPSNYWWLVNHLQHKLWLNFK